MSILHAAAARGDLDTVQHLLAAGDNPNRRLTYDGETPLIRAAGDRRAGVEMLRLLVTKCADPFIKTTDNHQSALHAASKSGSLDKAAYLLSLGANVNERDRHGYAPILFAAWSTSPTRHNLLRLLLSARANPYRRTDYNETAVGACASDFDALKLFDQQRAADILRWNPLMAATAWGSPADMRSALRQTPNLRAQDTARRTVWHIAIETGDTTKTKQLYDQDNMPMGEQDGLYPNIFYALQHNHSDMLAWLIDIGADIHAPNPLYTAMEYAAIHGAADCVQILLAHHLTQQQILNDALAVATNTQTVTHLLNAGANVDHVNREGCSALLTAVEDNDIDRVRYLLEHGAAPNHPRIGETPLIRAVSADFVEIVRLLLSTGADPNLQTNPDMWFALQYVRSQKVMRLLLDAGAGPTLSDAGGTTAHRELWDERLVAMLEQQA